MDQAGDVSSAPGHAAASVAQQAAATSQRICRKAAVSSKQNPAKGSQVCLVPSGSETALKKNNILHAWVIYLQTNGTNRATVLQHPGLYACTGMCACT